MTAPAALLQAVRQAGGTIRITADQRLQIRGITNPDLIHQLRTHRDALTAHLTTTESPGIITDPTGHQWRLQCPCGNHCTRTCRPDCRNHRGHPANPTNTPGAAPQ